MTPTERSCYWGHPRAADSLVVNQQPPGGQERSGVRIWWWRGEGQSRSAEALPQQLSDAQPETAIEGSYGKPDSPEVRQQ